MKDMHRFYWRKFLDNFNRDCNNNLNNEGNFIQQIQVFCQTRQREFDREQSILNPIDRLLAQAAIRLRNRTLNRVKSVSGVLRIQPSPDDIHALYATGH